MSRFEINWLASFLYPLDLVYHLTYPSSKETMEGVWEKGEAKVGGLLGEPSVYHIRGAIRDIQLVRL